MSALRKLLGVHDLSWEAARAIPSSKIAKQVDRSSDLTGADFRHAFRTFGVIRRAICLLADLETARGYELEFSGAKGTEECIMEFLANIARNNHFNWDLREYLRHASINADIFGNDFKALLPEKNGNRIVALQPLSPIMIDLKRDSAGEVIVENGKPVGFIYKDENTSQEVDITSPIAQTTFTIIGDEFLGRSLIEACYNQIDRMVTIEEGTAQAIAKFGAPFLDVSLEAGGNYEPSEDDINDTMEQINGITQGSGWVHPSWKKAVFQNPQFPRGVTEFQQLLLDAIVTTTGIPKHLLVGQGQLITKATAESLQRMLNPFLEPRQESLSRTMENQVFARVLANANHGRGIDGQVKIVWNDIMPEVDATLPQKIKILSTTTLEGRPIISWNEAREMLGLESGPDPKRAGGAEAGNKG